jgi:hypothetical protein
LRRVHLIVNMWHIVYLTTLDYKDIVSLVTINGHLKCLFVLSLLMRMMFSMTLLQVLLRLLRERLGTL